MKSFDEKEISKLISYIGFARKSGSLTAGCDLTVDAIRSGKPKTFPLVVLKASDASKNTEKRISNACSYYEVECLTIPLTSEKLGDTIGKAPVAVVGISNKDLTKAILNLLNTKA